MTSLITPSDPRRADATSTIDRLVAATPDTRDRAVDFLRAFSILVVVLWHWVFSITHWSSSGALTMPNPVGDVPGLWLATWVLQIMPLFFFVGGFANYVAWKANERNHGTVSGFLRAKLLRLVKPIAVMLGVWALVDVVLRGIVPGYTGVLHWGFVVFVPLWFLGVYSAVVALAPLTLSLHQRAPLRTLFGLALLVASVDIIRFAAGDSAIGFANGLLVFLFVHQLGYFYGDGSLIRLGRRAHWAITLGGLGAVVALTNLGPYPHSMVAVQGESVSNMFPPTACIAALGVFQAGLALLLRPTLNRWLSRRRPWKVVVAANSVSMTVFAWHMTGLVLAIGAFDLVGGQLLSDATAVWWRQRPLWLLLPSAFLAGLIAIFARFELGAARGSK
jgi:peptidoglycan/LPS O-acetylase OafA/YrhL